VLGDVVLSFTTFTRVPDRDGHEVGDRVDLETALEHVPVQDRAELTHGNQTRLPMIADGKGGELAF
jgi:hypothetical protein